ncbi:hypothetical protein [Candidatus Ichthyocystis sparus]|uniref:hypothetical protein n=1 Tax=Candidatus Ichthyocystis sparus TaxID=1561004 RepID=UPI000B8085B1|nr:hypothetical protein [Candidatus Ichthyocystis sparus]
MINQPTLSSSYEYYDLENKEEEKKVCESNSTFDVRINTLLEIIKTKEPIREKSYGYSYDRLNRPPSPAELRMILIYKKWESEINNKSKSIINPLLNSFAKKLNEINCGSWEEKKEFLSILSGEASTYYPFEVLNNLMIKFVNEKISKKAIRLAKHEIIYLLNKCESSTDIKGTIIKKIKETILEDDNKFDLVNSIFIKIGDLHKKQCIKKNLAAHFYEKKISFATFSDLYVEHITENYEYILSKFVDIFDNLGQDEECCISFAFDTFLGEMVLSSISEELDDIIFTVENNSKMGLRELRRNNTTPRHVRDFIKQSKEQLEEKIMEYMTKNPSASVIEDNIIIVCRGSSMKKILYYSKKYLEKILEEELSSKYY